MPVRSLTSSVLKWPDAASVVSALRSWVDAVVRERPEVTRVGCFGSYARGDWGVGSDLDVVIVVDRADAPFASRSASWDTNALPVPTDVLVYTSAEWKRLNQADRPRPRLLDEVQWIFVRST